jgi:hypothetical protein
LRASATDSAKSSTVRYTSLVDSAFGGNGVIGDLIAEAPTLDEW